MELKNLSELKKFVDSQEPKINGEFTTSEGLEKQFKNRISNNACIYYAVVDENKSWSMAKFYCDKNGAAITEEKYVAEKNY